MRGIIRLTLGAVAGGAVAAALLPVAVATADEFDFSPDTTTFAASQVEGYPPLVDVVTGSEDFGLNDLSKTVPMFDSMTGVDTMTTSGSFTNNDFLFTGPGVAFSAIGGTTLINVPSGAQIDLADFGGGFQNEWIDIPAGGTDPGASDLFITPFGDFSLFGSFFTDLSSTLG
jgi:hypothetical protein